MSKIGNIKRLNTGSATRRYETFSYLPEMGEKRLRKQIGYLTQKGWTPALEHTGPGSTSGHYWYLWKLPFFGETDTDRILAEIEECKEANPGHLVRLIGYDRKRQTQGFAVVVERAQAS